MNLTPQRKPGESFKNYVKRRKLENNIVKGKLRGSFIYKCVREARPHMPSGCRPYIKSRTFKGHTIDVAAILHERMGFR